MNTSRVLQIVLGIAILVAAGWLAFRTIEEAVSFSSGWDIVVGDPFLIGNLDDPFVYAGGDAVRSIEGEGRIRFSEGIGRSIVRMTIRLDGSARVLDEGEPPTGELVLRSRTSETSIVESDVTIHGGTTRGEAGLPETTALLFGAGPFDLLLDGETLRSDVIAVWSVAHGLRKEDGAIRNQGLVFSPLLRDDTVFANPDRIEATLLLYAPTEDGEPRIVLHVVFRRVEIVDAPRAATLPE